MNKVLSIVENIKKGQNCESNNTTAIQNEVIVSPKNNVKESNNPRGMPKSGRFWKSKKERFGTINQTKSLKQSFQKKQALRVELKRTKELSKQVQQENKQKELARKERRRDNMKRAEENKKKAEIVQVITNTAKLKRMKKKQLRFIQKRDTNKEVEGSK